MLKSSRLLLVAICIFSCASVLKITCEENKTFNIAVEPETPPFGL